MLSIDEAISHCLEVAEQNEKKAEYRPRIDYYDEIESRAECLQSATYHRQLAEWLTELKEAKELLKEALIIAKNIPFCDESFCKICKNFGCEWGSEDFFEWEHEAEALKLIES